jgi:hypothetical protein
LALAVFPFDPHASGRPRRGKLAAHIAKEATMTQHDGALQTATHYPGRTLGIVGLILAFVMSIAGIIVSAVGLHESRRAGIRNPYAIAGLAVSIALTALQILAVVAGIALAIVVWRTCGTMGNGIHYLQNGSTMTCTMVGR